MILGLDLGSNSLGWALLRADDDGLAQQIHDAGVRIFPKAVEEKTPTPKNQKRRNSRLARRTIQRRARRKKKLLNCLVSLNLLPRALLDTSQPEGILNKLGDPYQLRSRALDHPLTATELGRVLLHLVQRRGFLSSRKTLLGRDMLDDPDVLAVLGEEDESEVDDTEESAFKADINQLRRDILEAGCRTLGEYLASKAEHACKRNRHDQHLRTDRQMYLDELALIFERQAPHHSVLTQETQDKIEHIIFHQRPLKLKKDRIGKCSLEPKSKRAAIARLEYQRFRYLQDINNLAYLDPYTDEYQTLSQEDRKKLTDLFEVSEAVTFAKLRKTLGLDKKVEFNLDSGVKKLRGNTTAVAIRSVFPEWDTFTQDQQYDLVEDLLTIKKRSALKRRLMSFWKTTGEIAVKLCLLELEPDYGSVSLKAIRRLLPHLELGLVYSDARQSAGYTYEMPDSKTLTQDKLGPPPELPNPIVNKALHELRRVVNAIIREHGKPDVVRIEMARDLEMNTRRYKSFRKQQEKNTKSNDRATEVYQQIGREFPKLKLSKYPAHDQKIRYRLWEDQGHCCAYSGRSINLATLFSGEVEVDHILPYSQSLDDSYMNKVVCFTSENRLKRQQTPIDAFGGNEEKWNQISQMISRWPRELASKRNRFYQRANDLLERDFIGNQLTDTRYIAREAGSYLRQLGVDVTYSRGIMTDWLRHQWQLNDLIGSTVEKERTDHRHHTIDAVVTACIDRPLYNTMVKQARDLERSGSGLTMKDIYITPPFVDIKQQLAQQLDALIVSHVPQRKITGGLHEETGVGFIEGVGTVYRQRLDQNFDLKKAEGIVDDTVRKLVIAHLEKWGGGAKKAFSGDFKLLHQDGKTPIKRVRVVQSKTTREKLEKSKFPIRNDEGIAFKWHAFGNTHHVEIVRHRRNKDKIDSHFVTAMEAAQRVRAMAGSRQQLIRTEHGEDWELLMVLHINDLVEVIVNGSPQIHRVQKMQMDTSQISLRLHTAATIKDQAEGIRKSIGTLTKDFQMRPISVNAIGKLRNDQAHS
jgi:CRISPR-associated endonuclease Csn1